MKKIYEKKNYKKNYRKWIDWKTLNVTFEF